MSDESSFSSDHYIMIHVSPIHFNFNLFFLFWEEGQLAEMGVVAQSSRLLTKMPIKDVGARTCCLFKKEELVETFENS